MARGSYPSRKGNVNSCPSAEDLPHDLCVVRRADQSLVEALERERQVMGVETQERKDRRLQIVDGDLVLGDEVTQIIGLAERRAAFDAAAGQPHREAVRMMVAAHAADLKAARSCGLRTGFIYRPHEFGNGSAGVPDKAQPGDYDVVSVSAIDLAQQLGA